MKTSSGKAKGRRLQDHVVEKLLEQYYEVHDEPNQKDNIKPAIMGESGVDIKLSPHAKQLIPFDIECKNQESINIWKSLEQAETNTGKDRIPLLVFKRNRSKVYAVLEFEKLLELIK